MHKIILSLVLTLAFTAANAELTTVTLPPPDFGSLFSEVQNLVLGAGKLNTTLADADAAIAGRDKEDRLYISDQHQKKEAIAVAAAQYEAANWKPKIAEVDGLVVQWNTDCAHEFDAKTQMAAWNACQARKAAIEAKEADYTAWWKASKETWEEQNVNPVLAVMAKQNAKINQNLKEIELWDAAAKDAQAGYIRSQARIQQILGEVKSYCTNHPQANTGFTYNEWVKWCSSINWDGAAMNLPPLYSYQGTGSIMQ